MEPTSHFRSERPRRERGPGNRRSPAAGTRHTRRGRDTGGGSSRLRSAAGPGDCRWWARTVFTRLGQRSLERVDLMVSDGAEGVVSGAAMVCPGAALHDFAILEGSSPSTPPGLRRSWKPLRRFPSSNPGLLPLRVSSGEAHAPDLCFFQQIGECLAKPSCGAGFDQRKSSSRRVFPRRCSARAPSANVAQTCSPRSAVPDIRGGLQSGFPLSRE